MTTVLRRTADFATFMTSIVIFCFFTTLVSLAEPKVETSVVIGNIDVSDVTSTVKPVHFAFPEYTDGSSHQYLYRGPGPCDPNEPVPTQPTSVIVGVGPCLHVGIATNYGTTILVSEAALLDVVIGIANWPTGLPAGWPYSVTIELGNQSQNAAFGTTQVEFKNVVGSRVPLTFTVNGALSSNGTPAPLTVVGILPLVINRK
jgi:hypothetical protein